MLKAILQRKTKSPFEINEDSFTSSIFQLLTYLPMNEMWDIICEANTEIPHRGSVKLKQIDFWCKWDATGTTNIAYVEPDVFLRFEKFDVIIEAKRLEEKQQYLNQWENEFIAYLNEFSSNAKEVFLIALGGIRNKESEQLNIDGRYYNVYKVKWESLLYSIKNASSKLKEFPLNGKVMIYHDLIASFAFHGYFTGTWIAEKNDYDYVITNDSIQTLLKYPYNK